MASRVLKLGSDPDGVSKKLAPRWDLPVAGVGCGGHCRSSRAITKRGRRVTEQQGERTFTRVDEVVGEWESSLLRHPSKGWCRPVCPWPMVHSTVQFYLFLVSHLVNVQAPRLGAHGNLLNCPIPVIQLQMIVDRTGSSHCTANAILMNDTNMLTVEKTQRPGNLIDTPCRVQL